MGLSRVICPVRPGHLQTCATASRREHPPDRRGPARPEPRHALQRPRTERHVSGCPLGQVCDAIVGSNPAHAHRGGQPEGPEHITAGSGRDDRPAVRCGQGTSPGAFLSFTVPVDRRDGGGVGSSVSCAPRSDVRYTIGSTTKGVGCHDGVDHHGGRHLERFVVRRLPFGQAAFGDAQQHCRVWGVQT